MITEKVACDLTLSTTVPDPCPGKQWMSKTYLRSTTHYKADFTYCCKLRRQPLPGDWFTPLSYPNSWKNTRPSDPMKLYMVYHPINTRHKMPDLVHFQGEVYRMTHEIQIAFIIIIKVFALALFLMPFCCNEKSQSKNVGGHQKMKG